MIKDIAKSFLTEVRYIQGSMCGDKPEVKTLRWISLHTVAGTIAVNLGLSWEARDEFLRECGFDSEIAKSWRKS